MLLEDSNDKALEFLKRAFVHGSKSAYETLRGAMTRHYSWWSDSHRSAAACALGEALMERFPGGERENEAVDVLRNCHVESLLADIFLKRFKEGRSAETEVIWLLGKARDLYHLQNDEHVVQQLVVALSSKTASTEGRIAAANYLYGAAAPGRASSDSLEEWRLLRAKLDTALRIDPSPTAMARHADALVSAAVNVSSSPPDADLQSARSEALRIAASEYEMQLDQVTADQLARLAVLTWRGFVATTPSRHIHEYFRVLVQRGDASAENTIAFLNAVGTEPAATTPSILPDAFERDRSSRRDSLCHLDKLTSAIDVQQSLYLRLTQMRGFPDVAAEVVGRSDLWGRSGNALYSMLPEGTAVLLYAHDYMRHCVWLLDRTGIAAFESLYSVDGLIDGQLKNFYRTEGISAAQSTRAPTPKGFTLDESDSRLLENGRNASIPSGNDALRPLSLLLLPGAISKQLPTYKHLIVVPYGQIGAVPFSALTLLSDGSALLDHVSISVAPSIVDLFASGMPYDRGEGYRRKVPPACVDRETSGPARSGSSTGTIQEALIVGDPDFSSGDPDFELPQLPGSRAEALEVAQELNVGALTGEQATPASVLAQAENVRLLYFATHGVSYSRNGLKGFLALAGGRWTADEIQRTCLARTRLAVLSACQTGLGQVTDGGMIGLARAFQIAGVSDVVMSLWKVNDRATHDLMTRFVHEIRMGTAPHEALRTAMIVTRKTYTARKHWASFTLFSDAIE
jgi:hypothetical protein